MHLQYLPKREKFDGNCFGDVNLCGMRSNCTHSLWVQ